MEGVVFFNIGGKLIFDIEFLVGEFERILVVYFESFFEYFEVVKFVGFDVKVGDRVVLFGYVWFGINIINN